MTTELRTIPGVELVKTGSWDISTGKWNVTRELIAATKASHEDSAIPRPIVKIGHTDERFDGEPALGWIENLRITDGGDTLVGDLAGVPAWLSDIAASAYPRRSVEGVHNLTVDGTTHPFILTAVALLGVTRPGISTLRSLADVRELYNVAASAGTPITITLDGKARSTDTLTPRQRVMVRAAAARRRHRAAQQIITALTAEQEH